MSFEWRTDEEEGWPEEGRVAETAVPNQPFLQRRWRFLLVVLAGLLGVWLVVQWQIDQRVNETTDSIETEILATHNFVLQTAVNQDESLFRANLSGRNLAWTELQSTLLNDGLLLGRPMLGWQVAPRIERLTPDDVTITLDPGLRAAELVYPQSYVVQPMVGYTQTITLQQTAVYRQGTSRWLYSPPDDAFWGEWQTWSGKHLTLAYLARETDIVARLGPDLDGLLEQMCTELADLNCGARLRVNLRLTPDPDVWLALDEVETMLQTGLRLELPTPTLVGLPTDEVSYPWLYRAYGVQLATAVLAHQTEYECCAHQLFFRALRDYQLAQLNLQPWPLTQEMYQYMLNSGFNGDIMRHWTRRWEEAPPQFLQVWLIEDPEPIWQQVYMLVEFLAAQEEAVSLTQMMHLMNRNSYNNWLADVLAAPYPADLLERRFLEHIYSKTAFGQLAEPPIPLPESDLTLVCQTYSNSPAGHVYTYNLARKIWTERFRGAFSNAYVYTLDGDHFIVSEYRYEEPNNIYKFSLATEDEVMLLEEAEFAGENDHWLNYSPVDNTAEFLVRSEYFAGERDISLVPTACADGDCPAVQLGGFPIFAPNKAHLLVEGGAGELINVGPNVPVELLQILYLMEPDGNLRQLLGQGGEPFWLTNSVYGFVQMGKEEWELVTAVVDQNQPRYLLSQTELLAAMPSAERPEGIAISRALANPANPQELLLLLRPMEFAHNYGPDTPSYLFTITLTSDFSGVEDVDFLRSEVFSGILEYAGDGRYIIHGDYGYEYSDVTWYFYNARTGQTEFSFNSISSLPVTDDGQWYVQYTDSFLLLHAPAYNYQYFIPHNWESCQQVVLSAAE